MTNSAPIVVFDFDLTLTRWDTADHFFRWLIRRTWWRLAMVCIALPAPGPLLRPFIGGLARDQHCFGRHKVRMLSERGFAPPWATAYTDHHVGLPILELSTACYLINPTPQSFARIKQVLPAEATILTWR